MMTLALHALETTLNAYLTLDPDTLKRLAALQGKAIKLVIDDWKIDCYIIPHARGVELHHKMDSKPYTLISGKLNALLRLGLAKGEHSALFENKIHIEGDLATAEAIRDILSSIDIDWEEHLSKAVGDSAAYKISAFTQKIKASFATSRETLQKNLKEFLQLEWRALPTRTEVDDFIDQVTVLQHAVARLEARIQQLQPRRKSPP